MNGLTTFTMTKLDTLSGIHPIKVCVGYKLDGKRTADLPGVAARPARRRADLRELPGLSSGELKGRAPASRTCRAGARASTCSPSRSSSGLPILDRLGRAEPRADHRPATPRRIWGRRAVESLGLDKIKGFCYTETVGRGRAAPAGFARPRLAIDGTEGVRWPVGGRAFFLLPPLVCPLVSKYRMKA